MIPLATLGDWTAIGTVAATVGAITMWVQSIRQPDAYKDLEHQIREQPIRRMLRHPIRTIRRRLR